MALGWMKVMSCDTPRLNHQALIKVLHNKQEKPN